MLLVAGGLVGGVGLLVAPRLRHLVGDLAAERSRRIRSEERPHKAAHLHDSVLQTLALIQRNAHDPARMTSLARRQERELRTWLYGDAGSAAAFDGEGPEDGAGGGLRTASSGWRSRWRSCTGPGRGGRGGRRPAGGPDPRAGRRRPGGDGQRRQAQRGALHRRVQVLN